MSFPKGCPHCDAGLGQHVNRYLCGTYLRPGVDTHKHQTKLCIVRELAAANARIRRLEATLENVINSAKPNQAEHPSMWNAWFKARLVMEAKETKP